MIQYELERGHGEEIVDYDTRFVNLLTRFEQVSGGELTPLVKAHVFLRMVKLPASIESQVISGTHGRYTYESMRDSALTSIPRVTILRGLGPTSIGYHSDVSSWKRHTSRGRDERKTQERGERRRKKDGRFGRSPHKAHATYRDGEDSWSDS